MPTFILEGIGIAEYILCWGFLIEKHCNPVIYQFVSASAFINVDQENVKSNRAAGGREKLDMTSAVGLTAGKVWQIISVLADF